MKNVTQYFQNVDHLYLNMIYKVIQTGDLGVKFFRLIGGLLVIVSIRHFGSFGHESIQHDKGFRLYFMLVTGT